MTANEQYFKVVDQITASSPDANRWFSQALEAASTWDHIVDKDEIDIEQSDRTMEALLTEWTINPFFLKHATTLVPVMVNAISAWRFSNNHGAPKIKAYDFYTEIPTTLAFLLMGKRGVAEYIPELRALVLRMHDDDELRDDQKK